MTDHLIGLALVVGFLFTPTALCYLVCRAAGMSPDRPTPPERSE